MTWNREIGNAYTAATWISAAYALAGKKVGETILAFSYGSGCGAELLTLRAGELASAAAWRADLDADLGSREVVDGATYAKLRAAHVGVR